MIAACWPAVPPLSPQAFFPSVSRDGDAEGEYKEMFFFAADVGANPQLQRERK